MTLRRHNIRTQVTQEALEAEEAARRRSTETSTGISTQTDKDTSTETILDTQTYTIVDTTLVPETSTETYTYSEEELEALVERRKKGKNIFEKTHERLSIWMLKSKKKKFIKLAKDVGLSQVELMDEALDDLFKKYRR